jgi:hypothetical protein
VISQRYLDFAQAFDKARVVPRVIFFGYAFWVMHITHWVLSWYMSLPPAERSLEASGLAGGVVTIITGLFPWIYRIYSDNATDWTPPTGSTKTVVMTKETT